ncbi:uncharacterized protein DEA37_0014841 [Paragonimus westermani]|uniref:CAP-Gly domain-containing protein n=1 Tax=Paragonimus westermani TaxID=34504 RepID=A0A5J4NLG7_9TREM|nr:uncharacterized protein DEA37_0014841 [Paragonimus westermani]
MNQPLAVHFDETQVSAKQQDDSRIHSIDCLSPTSASRNSESSVSTNAATTPSSSDSSQVSNRSRVVSPELRSFVNSSPVIIGDRVVVGCNNLAGTVAYIGPTHFSTESLAGVVLDEAKGKHDGTSHGIRYFRCPPNRGVLCRLSHLKKLDEGKQTGAETTNPIPADCSRYVLSKKHTQSPRISRSGSVFLITLSSCCIKDDLRQPSKKCANSNRNKTAKRKFVAAEKGASAGSKELIVTDRRTERRPHVTPRAFISEFLTQKPSKQLKRIPQEPDTLRSNGFMRSNDLLEAYANSLVDFSWTDCAYSKSRPKSEDEDDRLQVDSVISCAQDRLLQLQNQLLEVYRAKSRVATELEEQRKIYRKLSELYESRTSKGVLTEVGLHIFDRNVFRMSAFTLHPRTQKCRVDNARVRKIRSELSLEFERTKHIWTELTKLNVELEKSCQVESQVSPIDLPSGTEVGMFPNICLVTVWVNSKLKTGVYKERHKVFCP